MRKKTNSLQNYGFIKYIITIRNPGDVQFRVVQNRDSIGPMKSTTVTIVIKGVETLVEHNPLLPTLMSCVLRSIPSELLLRHEYSRKSELDTLEIIFKWLQVSVSECNRQTPQTENLICVYQGLGSERPSDLYNRFQGEILHYKSLPPYSPLNFL